MAETSGDLKVTRNEDESRYEIHVDGELGGYAEFYTDDSGRTVFPATEIDPAFKGQGLGTALLAEALADEAARGETIVPVCPFVSHFLQKHDVAGLTVAPADPTEPEPADTSA